MHGYRLYFFNRDDHIRDAVELMCADDEEALGVVDTHRDGRAMELWCGARLVKRYGAEVFVQSPPSEDRRSSM